MYNMSLLCCFLCCDGIWVWRYEYPKKQSSSLSRSMEEFFAFLGADSPLHFNVSTEFWFQGEFKSHLCLSIFAKIWITSPKLLFIRINCNLCHFQNLIRWTFWIIVAVFGLSKYFTLTNDDAKSYKQSLFQF